MSDLSDLISLKIGQDVSQSLGPLDGVHRVCSTTVSVSQLSEIHSLVSSLATVYWFNVDINNGVQIFASCGAAMIRTSPVMRGHAL